MVIDTKWKRMTPQIDDPKQGVSQGDVYQLMAYSQLYNCPNVMLLYPHHGELPPDPICTRYAIGAKDSEAILSVATLNMTEPRVRSGMAMNWLKSSKTHCGRSAFSVSTIALSTSAMSCPVEIRLTAQRMLR